MKHLFGLIVLLQVSEEDMTLTSVVDVLTRNYRRGKSPTIFLTCSTISCLFVSSLYPIRAANLVLDGCLLYMFLDGGLYVGYFCFELLEFPLAFQEV